jgi:hypothetical protein
MQGRQKGFDEESCLVVAPGHGSNSIHVRENASGRECRPGVAAAATDKSANPHLTEKIKKMFTKKIMRIIVL